MVVDANLQALAIQTLDARSSAVGIHHHAVATLMYLRFTGSRWRIRCRLRACEFGKGDVKVKAPLPARLRILSLPSHTLEPAPFMLTGKGAILLPATDLSTPGVYISGLVTIGLQM